MRRRLLYTVVLAALLTIVGLALFFALPKTNTYLFAPGLIVAFIANGGVHGNGLGPMFNLKFWAIAAGINFALYFAVSWFGFSIAHQVMVRKKNSGGGSVRSKQPAVRSFL